MKAIRVEHFGGPEVMEYVDCADPVPNERQELISVTSIGVNYADTHQIENSYRVPLTLPFFPGLEVVGVSTSGKRVLAAVSGGYAQKAVAEKTQCVEIPDGVSDEQALAMLIQGTTAWHILKTVGHIKSGESVVIHAAAGGVGTVSIQLAKMWGTRVIAVASSIDKRELAKSLGADVTVDANSEDLGAAILAANDGKRVDIVLEMVGGKTFDASLAVLAPFGRLVTFGSASRVPATPIAPTALLAGTKTVAGFWLGNCFGNPALVNDVILELFKLIEAGKLRPAVGPIFPLSQASEALRHVLARKTTGKVTLNPAL